MTVELFIGSTWFRYGFFPVLSVAAGILLRCATRNDKYAFFKKEDMAVGPQLMLIAILTFVVVCSDRAQALVQANFTLSDALQKNPLDHATITGLQKQAYDLSQQINGSAWLLLALVGLLWGVTIVVKRWGWKTEAEMYPTIGIAVPMALGVLSLVSVMIAVQP